MNAPLLDELTPRDWHQFAWFQLERIRRNHPELQTLDYALAHRIVGKVVRARGAQLRREHEAAASAAKHRRPVTVSVITRCPNCQSHGVHS